MLLFVCFAVASTGVFAQLKVNSSGKVGIGQDPDATYNLTSCMAIFKTGGTYADLIISGDVNPGRAIFPSQNNSCSVGKSSYQFYNVYGKYHYAGTTLLTSDKRLKENFRPINRPLDKILQITGQKYDFISQGADTIKDENEKQKRLRLEKDRLGLVAQDLEKIVPEAVFYFKDEDRYYIDYNAIIPVIIEAMKEQEATIEELKSQVAANSLKSAAIPPGSMPTIANQASLDQNIPNPFSRETRIGCTIPESSGSSVLYVYNMNGTQLQQYNVNGKGKQTITISGNSLEPGMYLYALVVDGQEVDTKRMILTK